ncbi:MAG: S16 family serine protease, partial [Candidatus Binataceae bacterium]
RAGIKTVILPRRNERDLDDIPPNVRAELETIFVDAVDEVLAHALRDGNTAHPPTEPEAAAMAEGVAADGAAKESPAKPVRAGRTVLN